MPTSARSMAITELPKAPGLRTHTSIFDSITLIKASIKDPILREIRKDYRFICCRCNYSQIVFGHCNVASDKPGQTVLTYLEQRSEGLVPRPLRKWSCGGGCFEREDTHVACNGCQFAVRYRIVGGRGGVWLTADRIEVMS
ncbi:uncharacterized protein LAJ45_03350 [Morchella importuna]|uniref:uncharacterized protein n=1 Tax=Morchella importuna TaxID=1174673 RepID=UPI001E8E66FD|nr:uncharacterized protein LAJ45_03350 [Morchella importuna]KAH8152510.1 hypothetical protein LAJ45_03350 [Morchella importuna]